MVRTLLGTPAGARRCLADAGPKDGRYSTSATVSATANSGKKVTPSGKASSNTGVGTSTSVSSSSRSVRDTATVGSTSGSTSVNATSGKKVTPSSGVVSNTGRGTNGSGSTERRDGEHAKHQSVAGRDPVRTREKERRPVPPDRPSPRQDVPPALSSPPTVFRAVFP